jgi:hypothetical protein
VAQREEEPQFDLPGAINTLMTLCEYEQQLEEKT